MNLTLDSVLAAMTWSVAAAILTWIVLAPLRRRWLGGALASVGLTGTAASIGALLGGIHEMLLPTGRWAALVLLAAAAGAVATLGAVLAARRIARDNRVLREAVAVVASGRVPDYDGRPLTAELEALRTELNRTAQDLVEARDRERALEAARRDLVTWISHDLRTPLAGLRALAEALEDGIAEDPDLYYKQIVAAVNRLSGMVEDLFELSRIQAGVLARSAVGVPVDELVGDCVKALDPLAQANDVELSCRAARRLTVQGNGSELSRALTNLIANAIRHTPSGGSVAVEAGQAEDDGLVAMIVQDQCGGIAEQDLPHVFEVGFRGEAARTPELDDRARAGLGLAIARGIVEAHGGALEVRNTDDGCRFTALLPLAV